MTIDITDRLVLHEDDVFAFQDEPAILLEGDNAPELVNAGQVSLSLAAPDPDRQNTLISCTADNALIWNQASGVMSFQAVDSAGPGTIAIQSRGAGVTFRNDGEMLLQSERSLFGALIAGAESRFLNHGVWRVEAHDRAAGVFLFGATPVVNTGKFIVSSIREDAAGFNINGSSSGIGEFVNSGVIKVTGYDATLAVSLFNANVEYHLVNSGRIIAESHLVDSIGIAMPAGVPATIENSGVVRADHAIWAAFSLGAQAVINSGKLVGEVHLADSSDQVSNSGVIKGDVSLGGGDDRYNGADGTLNGVLWGGLGDDALIGGKGGEEIHGDETSDPSFDGADLLKGGGGSDTLFGGGRSDTLKGGDNADVLHGEAGADLLVGGGGSDVYVFSALADSAPGAADTIAGLKANDWIDLSPIDADPDKPGDQAFSPGQVTLTFDKATGETRIGIDADGDTTADFLLVVAAGRVSFDQLVL